MNYSEVKAVSNVMLPNLMTSPLGSDNGAGFGWTDMTVFKGGLQVRRPDAAGGYAYGEQPIGEAEAFSSWLLASLSSTYRWIQPKGRPRITGCFDHPRPVERHGRREPRGAWSAHHVAHGSVGHRRGLHDLIPVSW
jgi:hypothetical protein